MNPSIQFKTTTLPFLIAFALACFGLSPTARAVTPAPDGGYPNDNTAEGESALFNLTTGAFNTAIGFKALFSNTTGNGNTATGYVALYSNTSGNHNTAIGEGALDFNTTGDFNTAIGTGALNTNGIGGSNTATGSYALLNNKGSVNTATGARALYKNTTAWWNTAMGFEALYNNTTGLNNIALGYQAGWNLSTGNNNIDIGNKGVAGESGKIRIGKQGTQNGTFIAGISGVAVTGSQVIVNTNGRLGVTASSVRFKEAIKPMGKTSETIHALKPVTFHYKQELDPEGIPQFGLVAEEVEKVNPALVARDAQGKVYTVRYEAVNAMLLNEFLKEHQKVQKLEAALAAVNERLKMQDAKIDRVSAKVELTKPAPQAAENN
jgi:Chaperone of endosialidase